VGCVLYSKFLGTPGVDQRKEGGRVHDSHNRTMSHAIHEEMFKKASMRTGLKTHTPNNLLTSGTLLIFQEKVELKQRIVRRDT
jgi:hypothetical protein